MQQIATGTSASHYINVYKDGALADLDAAPTYTITDASGAQIATGTASAVSTGVYSLTVPQQTEVANLDVAWSGTLDGSAWPADTDVEVVGEHLFTIAELRTFAGGDLASTSAFPNADLAEIRYALTQEFQTICGVAFVPRYERETIPGTGTATVDTKWRRVSSILEATISGTSVATSNFQAATETGRGINRLNGTFTAPTSSSPRNVTIAYRHGFETVPAEIRHGALVLAKSRAMRAIAGTGVPGNASAWSDATGTYQAFAANDRTGRWYGMPEIDVALRRFTEPGVF